MDSNTVFFFTILSFTNLFADKQSNRDWNLRGRSTTGNDYRDSDRSNPKAREPRTRERRASRSNSRSPSRKRSRSPQGSPRRRSRVVPRYSVQIPKVSLDWYNEIITIYFKF